MNSVRYEVLNSTMKTQVIMPDDEGKPSIQLYMKYHLMKQNKSTYKARILGTPLVHLIESFFFSFEELYLMHQEERKVYPLIYGKFLIAKRGRRDC